MNKHKYFLLVLLMLSAIFLSPGCVTVKGSGNLITEDRDVGGFDSIELSGSGKVIITQGHGNSLSIETDDNVMEHVKAEVDGGTLKLGFKRGLSSIDPTELTFRVSAETLASLSVSGSGDIEADVIFAEDLDIDVSGSGKVDIADLSASKLGIEISGSGEISLEGAIDSQDVSISGSGKYEAGDLPCDSAKVNISGSGKATVWATQELETNISGSGTINYYGKPSINASGGGSGELKDLGDK